MYNLLVIEDDNELRTNIYDLFSTEGYKVECAEDGMKGLESVRKNIPDLILCDLMMPNMDGYNLLEEIKKQPETAEIPIIFLTAKTEEKYFRKGMRLGADDYIFKPFDLDDLLGSVKRRLEKRELANYKLTKAQEEIAAKISHELRTPLVSILGYSNLAQEEDNEEEVKKMLKVVEKTAKNLHGKIEKFLLYKDLVLRESKHTNVTNNEFSEINDEMVLSCLDNIDNKYKPAYRTKVTTEKKILPVNVYLLEKLITELIENGLRYSDMDNEVTVKCFSDEDYYCIEVTDKGEGISEKKINSLTLIKQLSENQYKEEGIGLGLPIVMKIIEIYDGKFEIINNLDGDNVIKVRIPLR